MTYSEDFRLSVLEIREREGLSIRKTSARFLIGTMTIQKWLKGKVPKNVRNKEPTKIPNEKLIKDVEEYPDGYNYERAERLGVSPTGIFLALKRLGISRKKNHLAIRKQTRRKERNSKGRLLDMKSREER